MAAAAGSSPRSINSTSTRHAPSLSTTAPRGIRHQIAQIGGSERHEFGIEQAPVRRAPCSRWREGRKTKRKTERLGLTLQGQDTTGQDTTGHDSNNVLSAGIARPRPRVISISSVRGGCLPRALRDWDLETVSGTPSGISIKPIFNRPSRPPRHCHCRRGLTTAPRLDSRQLVTLPATERRHRDTETQRHSEHSTLPAALPLPDTLHAISTSPAPAFPAHYYRSPGYTSSLASVHLATFFSFLFKHRLSKEWSKQHR